MHESAAPQDVLSTHTVIAPHACRDEHEGDLPFLEEFNT